MQHKHLAICGWQINPVPHRSLSKDGHLTCKETSEITWSIPRSFRQSSATAMLLRQGFNKQHPKVTTATFLIQTKHFVNMLNVIHCDCLPDTFVKQSSSMTFGLQLSHFIKSSCCNKLSLYDIRHHKINRKATGSHRLQHNANINCNISLNTSTWSTLNLDFVLSCFILTLQLALVLCVPAHTYQYLPTPKQMHNPSSISLKRDRSQECSIRLFCYV